MTNDVLEALRKGAVRADRKKRVLDRECRSPQRTRRAFPGVNDFIRMRTHAVKRSYKKTFMLGRLLLNKCESFRGRKKNTRGANERALGLRRIYELSELYLAFPKKLFEIK